MSRQLIITADDYGMCPEINKAIEECLAAGALRATCVITNMADFQGAASLRRRFPEASIGIHWNLTQGQPLLTRSQVHSLVLADGRFHPYGKIRRRWLTKLIDEAEIRAELRAQYQAFREVAGFPDFWNTHENVHHTPGLFQLFVTIGREVGIPAMRCHRRITVPRKTTPMAYNLSHPLYWLKGKVIALWAKEAEARGMLLPAGRIDMPGYGSGKGALEEACRHLNWNRIHKPVEVAIHPATDVRADLFGDLSESRVREYEVFKDPRLVHRLQGMGIELVGFEALGNGR